MKQWLKTARVLLLVVGWIVVARSCERSIQRWTVAKVNVANAGRAQ
jgi:hypothetical protein